MLRMGKSRERTKGGINMPSLRVEEQRRSKKYGGKVCEVLKSSI